MRVPFLLGALALAGCGGSSGQVLGPTVALHDMCPTGSVWLKDACHEPARVQERLKRVEAAIEEGQVEEALTLVSDVKTLGPLGRDELISVYEQSGIAYGFLDRKEEAMKEFRRLLTVDPHHKLNCGIGPKATLPFEEARQEGSRSEGQIAVTWPQNLLESQRIPLAIEIVRDPGKQLAQLALYVKLHDKAPYQRADIPLSGKGTFINLTLPAANTDAPTVASLYGRVFDSEGNEVLRWFDEKEPRDISLGYVPPTPWYRKWWVWATIGGVVAVGSGTTAYLLGVEPPSRVGGSFSLD